MDNNSWDGFLEAQEFNYKMALKEKEIEGTWSEYSKLLNKLNYKGRMSKILKGAALGISEGCVLCYSVVNHRTVPWTEPDRSQCEGEGGRLSEKIGRVTNGM